MYTSELISYQPHRLNELDAETLERDLGIVIWRFQQCRARHLAQTVVCYLEALRDHAALNGGDERRCLYGRLVGKWRRLADSDRVVEV